MEDKAERLFGTAIREMITKYSDGRTVKVTCQADGRRDCKIHDHVHDEIIYLDSSKK